MTSYSKHIHNFMVLNWMVFEILTLKVRNVFFESPDMSVSKRDQLTALVTLITRLSSRPHTVRLPINFRPANTWVITWCQLERKWHCVYVNIIQKNSFFVLASDVNPAVKPSIKILFTAYRLAPGFAPATTDYPSRRPKPWKSVIAEVQNAKSCLPEKHCIHHYWSL
jgi:hypothetical protein